MTPDDHEQLVRVEGPERPEFAVERLGLDRAAAVELICESVGGVTATETTRGTKIRTQSGMLIAVVIGTDDGSELQYRTAPASDPATLKARRLWRAMRPHAV